MKRSASTLALALVLGAGLATPAQAIVVMGGGSGQGTTQATTDGGPVSPWFAMFDDKKPRQVRLLGLAKVPANIGVLDRVVRIAIGGGLTYLSLTDPLVWGTTGKVLTGVGAGMMGWSALTGSSLLYLPLGINTRTGPRP